MIYFDHLSKTYPGGQVAVQDLCMQIERGETLVLLGTSGSGKTTTMRMVNRLTEPTRGTVYIDGTDVMSRDPIELRRSIGYAIQHIGLFPHLTVAENISVVPELLNWDHTHIQERVDLLLDLVGLEPTSYRDRYPYQLSGGQMQRVGVARALAADPPVILMDEPFGALDPITRQELQEEFLELESEIKKTVIFVTHDILEAIKMGDRIALMDCGRLHQLATPADLTANPADELVEKFLGPYRFQLALLTSTVKSLLSELGLGENSRSALSEVHLKPQQSLLEALELFKKSGLESIGVYDGTTCVGTLSKRQLLKQIMVVLGGTE